MYSDGASEGGGYTFILNTDTGLVCELNLGGWAEKVVHWSSDGRYLAFIRSTKYYFPTYSADLTVLDTVTGNLKVLNSISQVTEGTSIVFDFAWAPDNRHLLATREIYTSPGSHNKIGLYLIDFVSGQSINVTPTYQSYLDAPQKIAWSPDGSRVVISCPAIETVEAEQICLISIRKTGQ
jgi:Tol biopolymer transport system component